MRTGWMLGLLGATLFSSAACSRNNIEAVNLSNEGDKARKGDMAGAISKYEQATMLDPTNHRILWKLATAYQAKEDWEKTATTCAKAEKLAPTYANYYALHGYALEQQAIKGPTSWADAKEPLATAIKLDPNLVDPYFPYFEMGQVLLHLDDEAGALQNFTKAIELKPDSLPIYGPPADLYIRLGFYDQAEQLLKEALGFVKEGDKNGYIIHSLMGEVQEVKGNVSGAVSEFELARKACGKCDEKGQQIAFFNLGAVYSKASPPRKSEAIQQLTAFSKTVCRGGAAKRFEDECTQAQEIVKQLGGTL